MLIYVLFESLIARPTCIHGHMISWKFSYYSRDLQVVVMSQERLLASKYGCKQCKLLLQMCHCKDKRNGECLLRDPGLFFFSNCACPALLNGSA